MKRLFTLVISFLLVCSLFAQTPELISYQAVIRNSSNELLANQTVGIQISILQGSIDGVAIYTETHSAQTDANGLVSVEIGGGNVTYGAFKEIQWGADTYFIKTETDPDGGDNYTITGVSQLLSVPYALHAKTAERVVNGGFFVEVEVTNASSYTDSYESDGEVSITFVGGAAPYKYIFTEAGVSSDYFGQVEGNTYNSQITFKELNSDYYEFYVEDANGAFTQRKVFVGHNSPIVYISNLQSSCINNATGSFDMNIKGGTPGYQYSINGMGYLPYNEEGITVENVSGYTSVEVIDAEGRRGVIFVDGKNDGESSSVDIPYNKPDVSLVPVAACGESDGGINITVDANTDGLPYSYEWYAYKYDEYYGNESEVLISSDKDLSGVSPGYYFVNVIDGEGCQSEAIGAIVGYSFQPDINSTSSCYGIDISILNYTGTVSYEWSAGNNFETIISTDQDLSGVETGRYYLRMTNEDGCVSQVYSYYYSLYMSAEVDYYINRPCAGSTNGSINISLYASNGESLSYEWATDKEFTNVISTDKNLTNVGVPEGEYYTIYYFRMTNEEGCQSRVYSIEMDVDELYVSLNEEITRPCSGSENGSINISPDYDGTLTYEWGTDYEFGNIVSTEEDLINVGQPDNGIYYLRVTNEEGCKGTYSFEFYSEDFYTSINEEIIRPCSGSDNGSINISPDYDGTLTYEWATDYEFGNIVSTEEDLKNVGQPEYGYYYLRITNEEGCKGTYSFEFYSEGFYTSISEEIVYPCYGSENGSIYITPDYEGILTYEWATDSDFSNVVSTEEDLINVGQPDNEYYYLRVTNERGCTSEFSFYLYSISIDIWLNEEIIRPCSGSDNGSINITPDYEGILTYEWATDNEFSNVVSTEEDLINVGQPDNGYYYLRVTNENGCTSEYSYYFYNTYLEISLNEEVVDPCPGSENGSINITPDYEGTLTYEWAIDSKIDIIISDQEDLSGLSYGSYYLRVTNSEGCSMTRDFYLNDFYVYYQSYVTAASSASAKDGSIQISVQTDGTFTYEWATDYEMTNVISTEEDLMNVAPGNYYLRITDAEGNMCSGGVSYFQVTSN